MISGFILGHPGDMQDLFLVYIILILGERGRATAATAAAARGRGGFGDAGSRRAGWLGLLARGGEAQAGPFARRRVEVPGIAREIDGRVVVVLADRRAVSLDEALHVGGVALDPARAVVGSGLKAHAELVFALDARGQHLELQRP